MVVSVGMVDCEDEELKVVDDQAMSRGWKGVEREVKVGRACDDRGDGMVRELAEAAG